MKPGRIVGNGAYVMEEWRINHRIRLRKNPYYWDRANVALETVDVVPTSRANAAFNFYSSGLADLMLDKGLVPPSLLGELRKRPDYHAAPFLGVFRAFQREAAVLKDPRVRKAIALVIDKKRIVEKITRATAKSPRTALCPGHRRLPAASWVGIQSG